MEVWGAIFIASCGSHPLPSRSARHPPLNGGGQVSIVAEWPFSPQSCLPPLDGGEGDHDSGGRGALKMVNGK